MTDKEPLRKIIRAYYNSTFEYAMEQLSKGDITAAIANAESKQKELDDPYLDQILALFDLSTKKQVIEARLSEIDDYIAMFGLTLELKQIASLNQRKAALTAQLDNLNKDLK